MYEFIKIIPFISPDPASHTIALLGTLPAAGPSQDTRSQAIIRIERMPLPKAAAADLSRIIDETKLIDSTDIVRFPMTIVGVQLHMHIGLTIDFSRNLVFMVPRLDKEKCGVS